jgi:lysophospholipase L1-like esterase
VKALLPIAWLVFTLIALEFGAGAWIRRNGDALDRTRRVVEIDAHFGWRQKPNLDTSFYGAPLRTNELGWRTDSLERIPPGGTLLLGPSSAFGWGVKEEDTYAAKVQAVNAGEIGYSTQQGRLLLASPEVGNLHPKTILIAYGVNDVDRHRFYFQSGEPDSVELAKEHDGGGVAMFRALSKSSLLAVLYKIANGVRGSVSGPPVFLAPAVRVPAADFIANLHALAQAAKRLGARVIFISTPGNFPEYHAPPLWQQPILEGMYSEAQDKFLHGDLAGARTEFEELAKSDQRGNEAEYYLAEISRREGKKKEAAGHEKRALETEPVRVHRDVLAYNALMRKAAAEEQAGFVDTYSFFTEADKTPLFVDPIHPSMLGHARIADGLKIILQSPGLKH